MEGRSLKNGFMEYEYSSTIKVETGPEENSVWINVDDYLYLIRFGANGYSSRKYALYYEDGSSLTFEGGNYNVLPAGRDKMVIRVGRGLSYFDGEKRTHWFREMSLYSNGWIWVDPKKTKVIKVFSVGEIYRKDYYRKHGDKFLAAFSLSDWTKNEYDIARTDQLIPLLDNFLIRHSPYEDNTSTLSWSAMDADFQKLETPLVLLLNRYLNPFNDICGIKESRQHWSIFTQSPINLEDTLPSSLYLARPGSIGQKGRIHPLYFRGEDPQAVVETKNVSISPSGEYFFFEGKRQKWDGLFYPEDEKSLTKTGVYLGRVKSEGDSLSVKIKHLGDFPQLSYGEYFAWFPGSNGFVVLGDYLEYDLKGRVWVYFLEENPIDWDSLPSALDGPVMDMDQWIADRARMETSGSNP
jgi:hypothetical protein